MVRTLVMLVLVLSLTRRHVKGKDGGVSREMWV